MSTAGFCMAASTASGITVGPGMERNSRPAETDMRNLMGGKSAPDQPVSRRIEPCGSITARRPRSAASRELTRGASLVGAAHIARLLLHVIVDAQDALDAQRRHAGLAADLAILFLDQLARRLVAVDAAENLGWNLAIRALRAVLVIHVEQHVFGAGRRFACHGSCSLASSPPARRAN